jgi:hypothetical protein
MVWLGGGAGGGRSLEPARSRRGNAPRRPDETSMNERLRRDPSDVPGAPTAVRARSRPAQPR